MGQKKIHSSIERRFIFSILWIGVIPMAMALFIGYFAAREGQQRTAMHNLLTNARKTASGIRLVVQERERVSMRIAQTPEIVHFLREYNKGASPSREAVLARFNYESSTSQSLESFFYLYDVAGQPCLWMENISPPDPLVLKNLPRFGLINLAYSDDLSRYDGRILSPVHDPDNGSILGYLGESQSVQDLLKFILEEQNRPEESQGNRYEVVFFSPSLQFTVLLEDSGTENSLPPTVEKVHPRLAEKLEKSEGSQEGAFFLWLYNSGGENKPVLMAYSRLVSYFPVYVAVHQPAWRVFAGINIAALVTVFVSAIMIGIFCLIAYRIINNNVLRPISLLNEGAQLIRQGNLFLKLRIYTGDELEELATSFNQMAGALRANMRHIKESEEKYRNLVLSMRDGMFQANAKDKITFINPAGAAILGYESFEDVLGCILTSFFVDESDYHHISETLAHSSFVENIRVWLKQRNGDNACVELSISRVFDEEGIFIGTTGTFRDVTRNVRLEQEVMERADRIAAINQIANVINSSVEAGLVYENLAREVRRMAKFDYAAVALSLNENTFETRQLYPELTGNGTVFPRMDDDNGWAGWVAQEKRYLLVENLQATTIPICHQFPQYIRSILCVPLFAKHGLIGVLSFGSRDMGGFTQIHAQIFEQIAPHLTAAIRNAQLLENLKHSLEEVSQAREKLKEANTELKSLDEMKTQLLSNVSHELRTPLVAIMGYSDMLLNNKAGAISDQQREFLAIMMRNAEKLSSLIDNLLDFSKLYHGSEELVLTPFDVVDCIQASLETVKPVADGRGITLLLIVQDEENASVKAPVLVNGDKGKLGQVFNNLLSNAVKFNDNGGTVTVTVSLHKTEVTFSVTDTGIGIPKEAQDKIFNRFYQYDSSSSRRYPGTGIGLSIAQDIVRLHGGRISVFSRERQGATFRFTLPLYKRLESAEVEQESPPILPETRLLIELVSRDRALVAQVRQVLFAEGVDTIVAGEGSSARSLAQKYNPDCIIVDIEPGSTGAQQVNSLFGETLPETIPLLALCDDEQLSPSCRKRFSGRVKRNFRKSILLSGIHYALTQEKTDQNALGKKILYIDDDEAAQLFIKHYLGGEGYEVDACRTGKEALTVVEKGDYWLVLLEITLPDLDGREVCRHIKENNHLSGIKVFVVTARAEEEHINQAGATYSDGFLLKPFIAEDILMAVHSLAAHRSRSQSV